MNATQLACAIACLTLMATSVALIAVELIATDQRRRPTRILWVALAFDAAALVPCGILAVIS